MIQVQREAPNTQLIIMKEAEAFKAYNSPEIAIYPVVTLWISYHAAELLIHAAVPYK